MRNYTCKYFTGLNKNPPPHTRLLAPSPASPPRSFFLIFIPTASPPFMKGPLRERFGIVELEILPPPPLPPPPPPPLSQKKKKKKKEKKLNRPINSRI